MVRFLFAILLTCIPLQGRAVEPRAHDALNSLRPGNWIVQNGTTVLGDGDKRIVCLRNEKDGWTIQFINVFLYSKDNREADKFVVGPVPAKVRNGVFLFPFAGRFIAYSFRQEENSLVMPAFLHPDKQTWFFQSPEGGKQFHCEFDPLAVPVGKAEFPITGGETVPRYYVYEEDPAKMVKGRPSKCLRFLSQLLDGGLHEQCRLVWNEDGSVRVADSAWYSCPEQRFTPLSDEELSKYLKLPDKPEAERQRVKWPG